MKILLFSSNDQVRGGLSAFLEKQGEEVQAAGAFVDFATALGAGSFDVALATYDGGEAMVEAAYNVAQAKRLRFVAIAQSANRTHAIELMARGAWGYVLEPLNVLELQTVLKRAADRTIDAARRFTFDVLAGLDDAFLVLSTEHRILFANPRLAELVERSQESLSGNLVAVLGHTDLEALLEAAAESPLRVAEKTLRIGASDRAARARATIIHNLSGGVAGATLRLRFVDPLLSELHARCVELRAASHAGLEACLDGDMRLAVARHKAISEAIDELRDPLVVDPIPVPFDEMLEICVARARKLVSEPGEVAIDDASGVGRILCRRRTLEQLLAQLIASSLQAAPGQPVGIALREEEGELVMELRDEGEMPEAPFAIDAQAEGRRAHLALALAALLAQHQGARIEPRSEGAGVTLRLKTGL